MVDTNPLVYIVNAIPDIGEKYAVLLGELSQKNTLIIPKIVYGELSLAFDSNEELNDFLNDTGIVISEISQETYAKAARIWQAYNKRRILLCQSCGSTLEKLVCRKCHKEIKIRQHILPDFLIGAFAMEMDGKCLVSGDKGYYSTYFPELNILSA
ncbi:MAG: PIN domain-containing protein [Proteobacteria bacterium]|nr:PIN domain-containing protein [Pseudomonadota bacterium]